LTISQEHASPYHHSQIPTYHSPLPLPYLFILSHYNQFTPLPYTTLFQSSMQYGFPSKTYPISTVPGSPLVFSCSITRVISLLTLDRKSTRLNSSHVSISYSVFCLINKRLINILLGNVTK